MISSSSLRFDVVGESSETLTTRFSNSGLIEVGTVSFPCSLSDSVIATSTFFVG